MTKSVNIKQLVYIKNMGTNIKNAFCRVLELCVL